MRHKKNARSHTRRRRRTVVHHNPKRRRRVLARSRNRRGGPHKLARRRNPRMRSVRRRRINRHRNPFGANYRTIGEMSLAAVIAGVAARAIPEKISALSGMNNGITGYALNILSGAFVAYLLEKTPLRQNGGIGGLVGTAAQVGGRIISDKWGKTVVTFSLPSGSQPAAAAVPAGMSGLGSFGDPSFNLGKYVKPYNFPLPNSGIPASVPMLPGAKALSAKATASKPLSRYRNIM